MADRFRFDPGQSRFTVQGFATGLLSAFAHSPTFAVRAFAGGVWFAGADVTSMALALTARADSLDLLDHVRDADRQEIEGRMLHEVLETARHPEIRYESTGVSAEPVARGRYQVRVGGRLSLHGVTRPHEIGGELALFADGLVLRGETSLRMSDYGVKPVTALGGAIRLKDELVLRYELTALPEGPGP